MVDSARRSPQQATIAPPAMRRLSNPRSSPAAGAPVSKGYLSDEIRTFLTTRRAGLSLEQAGIVGHRDNRRVKGLRREEVAVRAGISVDYYKRLERGNLRCASETVLNALGRALSLDEAEHAHLFNLSRAAHQTVRSRSRPVTYARLDGAVAGLLSAVAVPTVVSNGMLDILGANHLGRMLFPFLFEEMAGTANHARQVFLDPRSRRFWVDWEAVARSTAALLRSQLGQHPEDAALHQLIADVAVGSGDFRRLWAKCDVEMPRRGQRTVDHPVLGVVGLECHCLRIETEAGPLIVDTFSAHPAAPGATAPGFMRGHQR